MSEIGRGNHDGVNIGRTSEGAGESVSKRETTGTRGSEMVPAKSESGFPAGELSRGTDMRIENRTALELAQKNIESCHQQTISRILETNGKYMSEKDKARVLQGVDNIKAVPHDPYKGYSGLYHTHNGKSGIEVSAISNQQMERTTIHETLHFASKNREIIVPRPDKKGYTVFQTVGTRQSSWFHSSETGRDSDFSTSGRGLNEGLTTMFTNQHLTELSKEKGKAAEREGVYVHATEVCKQLENLVGTETLKEAYFGGNMQKLEEKVNSAAGAKSFEMLRESIDKTISKDYAERIAGMKEAQSILAKMFENGGKNR